MQPPGTDMSLPIMKAIDVESQAVLQPIGNSPTKGLLLRIPSGIIVLRSLSLCTNGTLSNRWDIKEES